MPGAARGFVNRLNGETSEQGENLRGVTLTHGSQAERKGAPEGAVTWQATAWDDLGEGEGVREWVSPCL